MKALVQRVSSASVTVEEQTVGEIGPGLAVLVGVARQDNETDVAYLARKITGLRIFSDAQGRFNLSVQDTGSQLLLVSQFTLLADTCRGRCPSFLEAAPPKEAARLFNLLVEQCRQSGLTVATGVFQAHMRLNLINDGPVTILLDSHDRL